MNILIIPDKFKGSLSANEVADAIEKGIKATGMPAEIMKIPFADGGEGTSGILGTYFKAKKIEISVHDPLMRKVKGYYYYSEGRKEAYIEMAAASGLQLLALHERNPMKTSTYGTGELISDALQRGAGHIILCIGGSATNDAGTGMACALGYRFFDISGKMVQPNGENLIKIHTYESPANIFYNRAIFTVLTDVSNPLYGQDGAAYIYGPQKGALTGDCRKLDDGLRKFAAVTLSKTGKDINDISGAGAAGGLGAGAMVFLEAKLVSGATFLMDLMDVDVAMEKADWVITGEGKLDIQTLKGKLVAIVCQAARRRNKKILVVCGKNELSMTDLRKTGISRVVALQDVEKNLRKSLKHGASLISDLIKEWAQLI